MPLYHHSKEAYDHRPFVTLRNTLELSGGDIAGLPPPPTLSRSQHETPMVKEGSTGGGSTMKKKFSFKKRTRIKTVFREFRLILIVVKVY